MFHKSKIRMVFAIVCSLLIMLAITLITIYVSNSISIRKENEEMLRTFVERYSLSEQPDSPKNGEPPKENPENFNENTFPHEPPEKKDDKRNEPMFKLSTFYSVAFSETGDVLKINNGDNGLESEEELLRLATNVLNSGNANGKIGNLMYLVAKKEGYILVAMIDGTINDNNQRKLLLQMTMIGSAALIVLFVVSIFIVRKIVRPMEENDEKQKRFVSDAGHELKTPIAVISANSELLKREIGDNEWLLNIEYENEKMSELIKQLLTLSRAESGISTKDTLKFSELIIGEILPFESLAFENNKKIESDIEAEVKIRGDANRLRQLASILLDNAISHGDGETIKISLKNEKHSIVLWVENKANDLKADDITHLFDRFFRTDESRNDGKDVHYGLGLSIAKAIVNEHNGTIRAEYKENILRISVTLPNKI